MFFKKEIVLSAFIFLNFIRLISSLHYANEGFSLVIFRLITLIIFLVLTVGSYKKIRYTTIILFALIALTGLGGIIAGFCFIPSGQMITKMVFTLLGVYFFIGGAIFVRNSDGMRNPLLHTTCFPAPGIIVPD